MPEVRIKKRPSSTAQARSPFPPEGEGFRRKLPSDWRGVFGLGCCYCSRQRNRNVTIWARVQSSFGAKSVALTPLVTPSSTAQSTAGA